MYAPKIIADTYERKARLYPALLTLSPPFAWLVVGIATHISSTRTVGTVLGTVTTLAATTGLTYFLTRFGRNAGKRAEQKLFKKWGGMPSAAIFRHRDEQLSPITKERFHIILGQTVPKAKAPTPDEEKESPETADYVYTAWSDFLRVNTRDAKKYPLVVQELTDYGYSRNVWGLRPLGIFVSLATLAASLGLALYALKALEILTSELFAVSAFSAVMASLSCFYFTSEWVRVTACAYAKELAETTDTFGKVPKETKKRTQGE